MPQIVAAVLIGAGIAAGVKWLAREMARAAQATRLATEDLKRREPVTATPRDLGALEYDAKTGVYRPVRNRAG
jgi:predicted lysophospholipase L1 biosynthesis ABC-type transport system permease subunit